MIEKLFLTIIEITISTSLIIIPLLLISPLLKKKYTAKWQYIIWLIIAIRLMIPINFDLQEALLKIPVPNTLESNTTKTDDLLDSNQLTSDSETLTTLTSENTNSTPSHNEPRSNTNANLLIETSPSETLNITPLKMVSLTWLIGLILFLIYQFLGYFSFKKNLLRWSRPLTDEDILINFKAICNELNLVKPIKVMKCKRILSPMTIGLFNPIILLPEVKIPLDELSIILKHELIHVKRHDILYKLIITIANSIHWFNPTVYFMVSEANKDLEFYCDEMVIKNMDIEYKTKYSNAILSVMHSKTNCNSILSTNFNGGVDTMKKRFKNIFDNRKKRIGILSITFILALVLGGSSLVACQSSQKPPSAEETAKSFLKGYYEVDNALLLNELQDLLGSEIEKVWSEMEKADLPEGDQGIVSMRVDAIKKYHNALLKNVKDYITDSFEERLLANREMERKLQPHSDYRYTLNVTKTQLTLIDDKTTDELFYDYSLDVKLTYEDGTSANQVVDGQISLAKVDNKWLVNGVHERTSVTPDKKYYNPPITAPTDITSDSKTLCDAYIQAMMDRNFSFIADHTANSLNNTTLEDGQKKWDTIKVDSGSVINGTIRGSSKYPDIIKAYYEIKINVSEPGNSDFVKGENTRWLYLYYDEQDGWVIESFVSTGTPDELWWDTVNGG